MTTPILTFTDYLKNVNSDTESDEIKERVRDLIEEVSALVELQCDRRFDRRFEARDFNARFDEYGGDINEDGFLILDDDLISSIDLINNHDVAVEANDYVLFPQDSGALYKWGIKLRSPGYWQWNASNDPFDAIQVYGSWGYGGKFNLKSTVALLMDDSVVNMTVANPAPFEFGQMLQVGAGDSLEYMLIVEDESSPVLMVERGYNGTEPISHEVGEPVYIFRADPVVRRLVTRICKWQSELDDSPLLQTVNVGNEEQTVNLAAAPDDVQKMFALLERKQPIEAV